MILDKPLGGLQHRVLMLNFIEIFIGLTAKAAQHRDTFVSARHSLRRNASNQRKTAPSVAENAGGRRTLADACWTVPIVSIFAQRPNDSVQQRRFIIFRVGCTPC